MKRIFYLFITVLVSPLVALGQSDSSVSVDTAGVKINILDEAVVYSFREGSEVKSLPASTSVVTMLQLERNRVESLKDLTSYVPNFFMPDYGSQLTSPVFIRGIGSRINSPSIGLYVDHIPYFDKASFDFDMYDIAYIEVLRGPQGTLYGRNTMGGIINVFSLSPFDFQGTKVSLSGGNHRFFKGTLSHYHKFNEQSGLSLSVDYNHKGGYFTNHYNNEKMGKTDIGSGKARYIHNFSDAVRMELFAQYEHSEQKGYPYAMLDKSNPGKSAINYDAESLYNRDFFTAGALLEWVKPKFTLRSTTSYSYLKDKQQVDQDFTPQAICVATQKTKQNMVSEEIIIKSNAGSNYQWLFGAFGFWQHVDRNVFMDFGDDAIGKPGMPPVLVIQEMNYDNPTYGWAVFHQSKINNLFVDGLSVAAGIRLDAEYAKNDYLNEVLVKQNGARMAADTLNIKLDHLQMLPRFTVNYKLNNQHSAYASVARGYKTGGFNNAANADKMTFDPEYSWNYELGVKLNFFEGKLTSEISAFYIDWRDLQISQTNSNGQGTILKNAGKATSKGFEIMLKVMPVRLLSITASYGYTHATFKDYKDVNPTTGVLKTNYDGKYIPYVPRNTASVNANYTLQLKQTNWINEIDFNVQYSGAGRLFWEEANTHKQDYYNQFNARVAFRKSSFVELGIWAQNIFDTSYPTFYFEALGNSFVQHCKPFLLGADLKFTF